MVKIEIPAFSENAAINDLLEHQNKQLLYTVSFGEKIQGKLEPTTNKNEIVNVFFILI